MQSIATNEQMLEEYLIGDEFDSNKKPPTEDEI